MVAVVAALGIGAAAADSSGASSEPELSIPQDIPFDRGICDQYAHQEPIC